MTPLRPPYRPQKGITRRPKARTSADPFLSALLPAEVAATVGAFLLVAERGSGLAAGTGPIDLAAVAHEAGHESDGAVAKAWQDLVEAERVGLTLAAGVDPRDGGDCARPTSLLRKTLVPPTNRALEGAGAPLDPATMAWVPVLRAAADASPAVEGGMHVAFRVDHDRSRPVADFAAHLAAAGARLWFVPDRFPSAMAVLRAELHGHASRRVVVMPHSRLFCPVDAPNSDEPFDDDLDGKVPWSRTLVVLPRSKALVAALRSTTNVYVWPIPAEGDLPAEVAAVVGAVIGPAVPDRRWAERSISALLPAAGVPAVRGLLAGCGGDPRDAGPTLRAVRAAVASGLDEKAACALVAGPAASEMEGVQAPTGFDPRLLVCGEEATVLLRDAAEAFARGGRVIAHGPPGSGKTSFAQALAAALGEGSAAVAGRPTVVLTPSRILHRAWGATERALRELWARADREGAAIVADEWGSLCGVREHGAAAGSNAYLVQSLTDEMLRAMDAHPGVPLVATVNDLASVDPAALRRFTFVLAFGDRLSPEQERLAWSVLLKLEPPAGWRPLAAAVADFAVAAARCRALGRAGAAAHASALAEAKRARTYGAGPPPGTRLN